MTPSSSPRIKGTTNLGVVQVEDFHTLRDRDSRRECTVAHRLHAAAVQECGSREPWRSLALSMDRPAPGGELSFAGVTTRKGPSAPRALI